MSSKSGRRRVSLRADERDQHWASVAGTGTTARAGSVESARERALSVRFAERYDREGLLRRYGRYAAGLSDVDGRMRRVILRSLVRRLGVQVYIGPGVMFGGEAHFEIGDRVRIAAQVLLQGDVGGRWILGQDVVVGAQCVLDGGDLEVGERTQLMPGVRVLTGPDWGASAPGGAVRIGADVCLEANAVIMPGVTIGCGAVIGAGVVVSSDVPAGARLSRAPAIVAPTVAPTDIDPNGSIMLLE